MPRISSKVVSRWPLASLFVLALAAACSDDPPWPMADGKAGAPGKSSSGGSSFTEAGSSSDSGGETSSVGGMGDGEAGAPVTPVAGKGGSGSGGTAGTGGSSGSSSGPKCGDGNMDPGEECDDGNIVGGDGCSGSCKSACEACLKADPCSQHELLGEDYYSQAFVTGNLGDAQQGPAAGVSKRELTANLFECYLENAPACAIDNKGVFSVQECWCANEDYSECASGEMKDGPCGVKAKEATESTDPVVAFQRIEAPLFASGFAKLLINCAYLTCHDECLPDLKISAK